MEKVAGQTRLFRRGAVYYHRAVVPADIQDTYGKSEETFSLRTKDHQEALRKVRAAAVEVDRKFDAHRRWLAKQEGPELEDLDPGQIKQIGEIYFAHLVDEDAQVRDDGFYDPDDPLPELPVSSFDEYAEQIDALDKNDRYFHARGKYSKFYRDEVNEVLTWENVGIRLKPESPARRRLAGELQAAAIKAADVIRARNEGDIVETPALQSLAASSSVPVLSEAVEEWAAEKAREKWVPKTEREHRKWMEHFIAVAGDKQLSEYNKNDARNFKSLLLKLPANWNKQKELKSLGVVDAADRAASLEMPPMSSSNVDKLLGFVGSFWTWASVHYDECPEGLFRGLKVGAKRNVRDERHSFAIDDLNAIFSAPIYTGCRSFAKWSEPGSKALRDSGRFWVPLISLFTGARSGEVIQLYPEDVRDVGDTLCFDINKDGEDKRLKTDASARFIPVHRTLIELGFLDYVEQRRSAGEQRLFPDLKMGRDGYYSSPFSKYYGRFLKSVGVKSDKKTFHSFRHSFEDACRNSGVPLEITNALQGHGESGQAKRYGAGYWASVLAEALGNVRYDGLSLEHLIPGSLTSSS